jgi:hypothetical protein
MWSFKTRLLDCRNLLCQRESLSVAFLQDSEHQVVQDPCDIFLCELRNLKQRLGAFLTSLGKHPHLHLAPALLLMPVHMEKDGDLGRGPTARAGGTLEPVDTGQKPQLGSV